MGDERPRLGRADDRWNVIACRGFNGMHVVDRADGAPLHFRVLARALSHALENHIRYGNHGHYAGRRGRSIHERFLYKTGLGPPYCDLMVVCCRAGMGLACSGRRRTNESLVWRKLVQGEGHCTLRASSRPGR